MVVASFPLQPSPGWHGWDEWCRLQWLVAKSTLMQIFQETLSCCPDQLGHWYACRAEEKKPGGKGHGNCSRNAARVEEGGRPQGPRKKSSA